MQQDSLAAISGVTSTVAATFKAWGLRRIGLRLIHTAKVSQGCTGQQKNLMFSPDCFTSLLVSGFEP